MVKGLSINFRTACLCCLISTQFIPPTVCADDDLSIVQFIPNYLSIDYGLDNDHGRSTFIFANLGLTARDRLLFGVGKQEETVSRSEEALDNKTYLLGYNYLPYSLAQIGIEYEFWGDNDKVTTDSLRITLAINVAKFAVVLTPEFRKIKVNNDSQCDEDIDSRSTRIDLSLEISEQYSVRTSFASFNYSGNLAELGNCVSNAERLEIVSRIDSVANDKEVSVGLDYFDNTETYGAVLSQSRTALLSQDSKTLSLSASTDRFDDWTLTVAAGATENIDDSSTLFVTGTITYYW